jgi:hypothetical protein
MLYLSRTSPPGGLAGQYVSRSSYSDWWVNPSSFLTLLVEGTDFKDADSSQLVLGLVGV